MKLNQLFLLVFLCIIKADLNSQAFIDRYLSDPLTFTVMGNSSNGLNEPRDLDFKPNSKELWIINNGNLGGGSTTIFYNAGEANMTSEHRKDSHSAHFLMFPSAIAFSEIGEWANTNEIKSTLDANSTFMGPALWSGDTNIYARVFQNNWASGYPLGSHIDMLHQSPLSMGIAHDSAKTYWVFDGWNNNLCRYNFNVDHGPGYDNHSAGRIWRYTDVSLSRVFAVPSHMVLDKNSRWLYIVNGAPKQVIRVNTATGTVGGNLSVPNTGGEPLQLYKSVTGAITETITTLTNQPCGIEYCENRLLVGDYTSGDILVYNTLAMPTPTLMGTIVTGQPGVMGIKVGPDGKIWFVNHTQNTLVRIDPSPVSIDASISKILSPALIDAHTTFHSIHFDHCGANIAPSVVLKNAGNSALTSAVLNYRLDNGSVTTMTWTGNLSANASATVTLPSSAVAEGLHKLSVFVSNPNGGSDNNPMNDLRDGSFRSFAAVQTLPYSEDFETSSFPPVGWSIVGFNKFAEIGNASGISSGGIGFNSLQFDNVSGGVNISGQTDHFISPLFDLSFSNLGTNFTFDVAHAQYNSSSTDSLALKISTDCGATWSLIYGKAGANLATAAPVTSVFFPAPEEWRTETVSLDAFVGNPQVIFAFTGVSNFGNNVFIDNLAINYVPVGITTNSANNMTKVFPIPSDGVVNIQSPENIKEIVIVNLLGQEIRRINNDAALKIMSVDLSDKPVGAYYIKITSETETSTRKIILR